MCRPSCEVCARLRAAQVLVEFAEDGTVPAPIAVAGAVSLVWQALEWAYGSRW